MTSRSPGPPALSGARTALSIAFRGRHLLAFDLGAIAASYLIALGLRFDAPSALFDEDLGDLPGFCRSSGPCA